MTRLAVRREGDPPVVTPARIGLVTVVTVQFLPLHWRNVTSEMPLVIESKHIGVALLLANELKLRMTTPKRIELLRIAPSGSRQLQNDLLRGMRMSMEILPLKLHAFLRGSFHDGAAIVTGSTLGARDQSQRLQAPVFLMTCRAGAVLHHIRLVQRVLRMTRLASAIDRLEGDAVLKAVP